MTLTLRELIEMDGRSSLDLDAELMVRLLLKDKPRKVTKTEAGDAWAADADVQP